MGFPAGRPGWSPFPVPGICARFQTSHVTLAERGLTLTAGRPGFNGMKVGDSARGCRWPAGGGPATARAHAHAHARTGASASASLWRRLDVISAPFPWDTRNELASCFRKIVRKYEFLRLD